MLSDRPVSQLSFQFVTEVFDGVKVRALSWLVKCFHTKLSFPLIRGHVKTVATKLEMPLPAVALKLVKM